MDQPPANRVPPDWRRPPGVSSGTWAYVNQGSIADRYDAFVANTPLCRLDQQIIRQTLSDPKVTEDPQELPIVLDLGCGTGRTMIPLATQGYLVIGVDLSDAMLRQVTGKACEANVEKRVHVLRANLVQMECLADSCVDHAVCMFSTLGMIQGRQNRKRMLEHIARAVRPSGKFVVHVHNRWAALHEPGGTWALVWSWLRSQFKSDHEFGDSVYEYRGLEKMFMHRYSHREFTNDLVDSGWRVDSLNMISLDGQTLVHSTSKAGGFIAVCSRE